MINLNLDYVTINELNNYKFHVEQIHTLMHNRSLVGSEFLGWLDLPKKFDKTELDNIKSCAEKIRNSSDVLIVIGIGGSYLGAKAAIDFLVNDFDNDGLQIIYAGHNMSSTYLYNLSKYLEDKDFSINVISKSGTTTEPAIAFRHFKNKLIEKYGVESANERIYATTDLTKGALRAQAIKNNWSTFTISDDIGGRFSVLSPVGLLPIACSNIDIEEILLGAHEAYSKYNNSNLSENDAYKYAVIRNILYKRGFTIEMLIGYEPNLQYFNEWFKQLFGESEGKNNCGIFPSSAIFSTDLHSLGQYIQEGRRDIFETVLHFKNTPKDLLIMHNDDDSDGLNYLAGKSISYVNNKAFEATTLAHANGGCPNIIIDIDEMSPKSLGHLIYFFEISCAMSGYLLGVNPFDQPGVEEYKNNMFALLGKEGFEQLEKKLKK